MDTTQTPNTPQELLELQGVTYDQVMELWSQLGYEDKDKFIFNTLLFMRNFYSHCVKVELDKDTPDTGLLCRSVVNMETLNNMIKLHESV